VFTPSSDRSRSLDLRLREGRLALA